MKKILLTIALSITTFIYANQSQKFSTIDFIQEKNIKNVKAYPNPFTSQTQISFIIDKDQKVILTLKNLLGKSVFKKEYKTKKGENNIIFYKDNLEPGMYIYSIQTDSEVISKRLVIK